MGLDRWRAAAQLARDAQENAVTACVLVVLALSGCGSLASMLLTVTRMMRFAVGLGGPGWAQTLLWLCLIGYAVVLVAASVALVRATARALART